MFGVKAENYSQLEKNWVITLDETWKICHGWKFSSNWQSLPINTNIINKNIFWTLLEERFVEFVISIYDHESASL